MNGIEERFLLYRNILNNLCSYSTLKEVTHESLLLKHGWHIVTSLQRIQYRWGRGKSNFILEKSD